MPTRPDDQAFPTPAVYADGPDNREVDPGDAGLTIREEFAKAIFAGMIASGTYRNPDYAVDHDFPACAAIAVVAADALIAALNANPPKE